MRVRVAALLLFVSSVFCVRPAGAYSLLTHEQLIDLAWQPTIVPLLLSRYPTLTPAQLEHARAYAYGGCVIQDIGYYPFGDATFSNLTHYVRTGDFVVNLFRNAGNADELAFAVGALSHYIGDTIGHADATNLAVPVEFPKLGKKYGKVVNYAQGEHEHVQTEFAFDIHEITHHRMAPIHYLRKVGLEVPVKQLALAYYQTYGIREDFTDKRSHRFNVDGYRFATRRFIPRIAYAVTLLHRSKDKSVEDSAEAKQLDAMVAEISKQNEWDKYRKHAGVGTYCLAGFIWILPKFGPLKLAAVKGPTETTEAEYVHSVLLTNDALNRLLRRFTPPPATRSTAKLAAADDTHSDPPPSNPAPEKAGAEQTVVKGSADPQHPLTNRDLDTGRPVKPAGYRLTDDTYAMLLHKLAAHPTDAVPPGIKTDILAYYSNMDLPFATKHDPAAWAQVQKDVEVFKNVPTSTDPIPYATYGDGGDKDPTEPN